MTERVLDWKPRFDPRSLNHRIKTLIAQPTLGGHVPERPVRKVKWTRHSILDQGREGACTGFMFAHILLTTPDIYKGITADNAREFYHGAQRNDEWEGEDYEGSSVLGTCKYAASEKLVRDYWWATTTQEIYGGLSWFGAMGFGTNWYTGMFEPDEAGYLWPTGQVEGGHAYSVGAVNPFLENPDRSTGAVRVDNSWGPNWGIRGSAFMTFGTVDRLLNESGEFCLPRKSRVRA